jgi:CheY-like chemotaxis protein
LLIVEDDPAIARSLRDGLEREGYRVTHAATGAAGVKFAQDHAPQQTRTAVSNDGEGQRHCGGGLALSHA